VRMLGRDGRPSPLGAAFAEYGRAAKTLHLLAMCDPDDQTYRRTVHTQLTVQESRHRLARKLFHGQRGELRQRDREGQEDSLGALGLVLNAVVLWNTRYTDAALSQLRAQGYPGARRRRRPPVPARGRPPQRPRPLRLHPTSRQRPAAAARPDPTGRPGLNGGEPRSRLLPNRCSAP